jgi:hypothetical protein
VRFSRVLAAPLLSLLAACGTDVATLPPPGVGGTVVVNVWEPDGSPPTVLVAERIRQEGARFERLVLDRVRARVVMPDLDCAVSSPSGAWAASLGQLTLDGPVRLAGSWQGSPLLGSATSASLARDSQTLVLEQLEMWHRGQRLTAPVAEMRRDRTLIAPKGMTSAPLPPELAAVLAALPDPLVLPR